MKDANGTIYAAILIAASTTLASEYVQHKPVRYGRTILGAFGVGLGLSVVATGSPDIANQLAWLIILTSILVNGEPIFAEIGKRTK